MVEKKKWKMFQIFFFSKTISYSVWKWPKKTIRCAWKWVQSDNLFVVYFLTRSLEHKYYFHLCEIKKKSIISSKSILNKNFGWIFNANKRWIDSSFKIYNIRHMWKTETKYIKCESERELLKISRKKKDTITSFFIQWCVYK